MDNFGNLCLIQRNINSKFSNLSSLSKKSSFKDMIEKGSLKLRLMVDMTIDDESWKASFDSFWKKLIKKLEDAYYGE